MNAKPLLEPEALARYADAIVKASLAVGKGEYLAVVGEPEHRELMVAVAEAGYRAGATYVDAIVGDPLVMRARIEHGSDAALGAFSPWNKARLRAQTAPTGAVAYIAGDGEAGYLDGLSPKRIQTDFTRAAKATAFARKARLNMTASWTIAAWPTDYWASQVYPKLTVEGAKRKLARDLLWFCRLSDEDGKGTKGWLDHVRAVTRRSERLTKLGLTKVELRGPGTSLDVGLSPNTRWLGGVEETPEGRKLAPNMPTEETFTSPDARAVEGTFRCTFPLSFRGRLIEGIRGELRGGELVRLEADREDDRDFLAAYLDTDAGGRRLGELALVDSSSRIGQKKVTYFNTLLDENAATHIAFGSGFGTTRTNGTAGVNQSTTHLDVMIGSPKLEVTGIGAKGKRVPLIRDGAWQI
ncbi:MAG TPA: aminopeptidase [Gaiellaceae bacterium]|nr:aminopeptidase [Gaiellaceae bacterium]